MTDLWKRFFTEKPQTKADFFLVWITMSIVPFVVFPVIGVLRGDVMQTIVDNWMFFIIMPAAAAATLFPIMRARTSSDAQPE